MSTYEDLSRDTHLERLKLAWAAALDERPHVNISTVMEMPDGTIRPFVSESWAAYVFQGGVNNLGVNYLAFLCDGRRRKMHNIQNPPRVNEGVAYVAGQLAVTQTEDPVWAVGYQGEARVVPKDDPLYGAIIENWISSGRFTRERLDEYMNAHGAAVGAHAVAAVKVTAHEPMNGLTPEFPRYTWWGGPHCPGRPSGIHEEPFYEHLHFQDLPTENVFEYVGRQAA